MTPISSIKNKLQESKMQFTFIEESAQARTGVITKGKPVSIRLGTGYYYNGAPFILDAFDANITTMHRGLYRDQAEKFIIRNLPTEVIHGPVLALH